MAFDPALGYDPNQYSPQGAGAQTIEQWIADQATSWTLAYVNGNEMPADLFANTLWQQLGVNLLPPGAQGSAKANPNNAVDPAVYANLHAFFTALSKNKQLAPPSLVIPDLPSGGPVTDAQGRADLANAANTAANNANNIDVTKLNNQGALDVANANNATDLQIAQGANATTLQVTGMNNAAAAERIQLQAAADAARQAAQNAWQSGEYEKARQFEAQAAELDRQFRTLEREDIQQFEAGEADKNRMQQEVIVRLQEQGMSERQARDLASRMSIAELEQNGATMRQREQIAFETEEGQRNRMQQEVIVRLQEQGMDQRQAADLASRMSIAELEQNGANLRQEREIASREAEGERMRVHELAVVNLQEAGMDRRQAEDLASRLTLTQLQEAGQDARNAARIAADERIATQRAETERYGIDTGAAVNREDIATRERISLEDRLSRERISEREIAEQARQFDLNSAEDRRQFNVSMMVELLDRGVQLARAPTDWVAHQYYMENMSIPLSALNFSAIAALLGAIPPTGPSDVGPMTGGPAALDGDTELARMAGTEARMVGLQEAIAANPGFTNNPLIANLVAGQTALGLDSEFGLANMESMLGRARMETLPQQGDNPVIQQAMETARQAFLSADPRQLAGPPTGQGQPGSTTALPGLPQYQAQPQAEAASTFTGSGNGQNEMLSQLGTQLGLTPEQMQRLLPSNLMAGQYDQAALQNSPLVQAVGSGADRLSQFRTAPAGDTRFGQVNALGIGLGGYRSGQDLNARLLLGNNSQVQGIQGLIESTGQDWGDTQRQAWKAAPPSQFEIGALGRRR